MSAQAATFQISAEQAETYESRFVPAIFAQWATPLLDAMGVGPGQRVLDVACGTGILARTASERVGPAGRVVGVDLSPGMLTVAGRLRPDLEWRQADAGDLPFDDRTFDAVACQSSLMFFPDVTVALGEMARVARPGGTVGVQVYASVDDQPAYGPWTRMVASHAGPDAVQLVGTYWSQGELDALRRRFDAAGLEVGTVRTLRGTARFPTVEAMARTEIEATPLVDRIDDAVYRAIIADSQDILGRYQTAEGVELPIDAHLVVGTRR